MREIKFRGQTQPKGRPAKWVYGDFFSQYKDGVTSYYIVEHPYGREAGREVMWPVNPETVGQYTGLKDKNGKEIYEGDILAVAGKPIYQVVWSSHMAMFDLKKANGESAVDNFDLCEVIGDIYSNPELLKAGKS